MQGTLRLQARRTARTASKAAANTPGSTSVAPREALESLRQVKLYCVLFHIRKGNLGLKLQQINRPAGHQRVGNSACLVSTENFGSRELVALLLSQAPIPVCALLLKYPYTPKQSCARVSEASVNSLPLDFASTCFESCRPVMEHLVPLSLHTIVAAEFPNKHM